MQDKWPDGNKGRCARHLHTEKTDATGRAVVRRSRENGGREKARRKKRGPDRSGPLASLLGEMSYLPNFRRNPAMPPKAAPSIMSVEPVSGTEGPVPTLTVIPLWATIAPVISRAVSRKS